MYDANNNNLLLLFTLIGQVTYVVFSQIGQDIFVYKNSDAYYRRI